MEYLFPVLSAIAAIVTIEEWVRRNLEGWKQKLSIALILVILSVSSSVSFYRLNELNMIRTQAKALLIGWPKEASDFDFLNRGEIAGIILGGMAFLEKHKASFPETYKQVEQLGFTRLKAFEDYSWTRSSSDDRELYKQASLAIIGLVKSIAK
jgi:hypothetical protein